MPAGGLLRVSRPLEALIIRAYEFTLNFDILPGFDPARIGSNTVSEKRNQ